MTDNENPYQPMKAYENRAFITSRAGRPLRILAEHLEPMERFEALGVEDTIVVFGSARFLSKEDAEKGLARAREIDGDIAKAERDLKNSRYYEAARELSYKLTQWSKGLEETDNRNNRRPDGRRYVICTGGGPGIMEAANRGASEAKGINMGLNIELPFEQSGNPYITRELNLEFNYFFMRKFWFAYLAKAIVAFPGGFGTMDELYEILCLIQTRKIKKRLPIVLFGADFWDRALNLEVLVETGTISENDMRLFRIHDSVDDAFQDITAALKGGALAEPGGWAELA